jgi:hypothetical protein
MKISKLINIHWTCVEMAQGTKVVVHVRGVKIYVALVEALEKKERQDETQLNTRIGGKTSLGPSYYCIYSFYIINITYSLS